MRLVFALLLLVVVLGHVALYLSSYGVLFSSRTVNNGLVNTLECSYYTGASVMEKSYLYTEIELLGRTACPRTIYFGEP